MELFGVEVTVGPNGLVEVLLVFALILHVLVVFLEVLDLGVLDLHLFDGLVVFHVGCGSLDAVFLLLLL